jgi:hypothetical protein
MGIGKMKKTLLFIACALCLTARAQNNIDIPAPANSVEVYTNSTSTTAAATTIYTNYWNTLPCVYHNFQFNYAATGTNGCTINLDRTSDFSTNNWVPVYTNTLTPTTNIDLQFIGKWYQYRTRVSLGATNATLGQQYTGQ